MDAGRNRIGVIIPARNAAATLPATLEGLSMQDHEESFDVVVVDDCSADETAAVAREAGALVVQMPSPAGPAAARNAGVAATQAPLLAFTDADCHPAPSWLREGLRQLAAGADLVTGPVLPVREPGPFDRTLRIEGPSPLFESANLFVTRRAFDAAGGFERPRFLPPSVPHFGEDVVFGWRVIRSGARRAYAPDALVRHEVFPRGPRGFVGERLRLRHFPPLVREVPELRRSMPLGIFLSPRTARTALAIAAAGAAVAGRSPLPLVAVLPYARAELDLGRSLQPSMVRYVATQALADIAGFGALTWASARHRTLVI